MIPGVDTLARWAATTAAAQRLAVDRLRRLRYVGIPVCMAAPPTITVGAAGAASTINGRATGNALVKPGSTLSNGQSIFSYPGLDPVITAGVLTANNIMGATRFANNMRVRLLTDAPAFDFEVITGTGCQATVMVDGQYACTARPDGRPTAPTLISPAIDSGHHLVKVDFGANVATKRVQQNPYYQATAPGTGYVAGDAVTFVGGTFTRPATGRVVLAGTYITITDPGDYSVLPASPVSVTTTGGGSGATFTPTWEAIHTTRKLRQIELILSGQGPVSFAGVNVGAQDVILPYGVVGPRIIVVGDSMTGGTGIDFPGGAFSDQIGQRLGVDDLWPSGLSGSGYLVNGGTTNGTMRQRLATDVTAYSPDLIIGCAGFNDSGQVAAALQAEVTNYWATAYATNPNSCLICVSPFRSTSATSPSAAICDAVKNGFAAAGIPATRGKYIDSIAEGWMTGGGGTPAAPTGIGNSEFYNGDGTHPSQTGHDFDATILAQRVVEACQGFV